jgi:hypothetical protein
MKKTILYRLFGFGSIPKKVRPILEEEGLVVSDEGVRGWFVTKNVHGPGKRYIHRSEGFSGCLVITKKRIICFTYWKPQINIPVDDPKLSALQVDVLNEQTLSISFESSLFRVGWQGLIELRFNTEKAQQFHDVLISLGAQKGAPADAADHCR